MIQINTIFLNEHLQKNIKDAVRAIAQKHQVKYELALLKIDREDEDAVFEQVFKEKKLPILTWNELKSFYKEENKKHPDAIYKTVYTFYIEKDDSSFSVANDIEKALMNISLYETIERPLPDDYQCTVCNWRGKYYELTSTDLGFTDIEENVCPRCESPRIQNLKIISK